MKRRRLGRGQAWRLATVVGTPIDVPIDMPVMLFVLRVLNRRRGWDEAGRARRIGT